MKKTAARLTLDLDPTTDILAEVGQKKGDRLLIGFAAETQNLVEEARRKMRTKNCDMVVGQQREPATTWASVRTTMKSCWCCARGENVEMPRASKRQVSRLRSSTKPAAPPRLVPPRSP